MNQERNIYIELPEDIKTQVGDEAKAILSKIMDECLDKDRPSERLQLLKQELFKAITFHKSYIWFKDKAHDADLVMHQKKYDKEIVKLNEVIQRKAAKE